MSGRNAPVYLCAHWYQLLYEDYTLHPWFIQLLTNPMFRSAQALLIHLYFKPLTDVALFYLRLTCDWTFEMIAMACNRSFNMLNIVLAIL